MSTKEEDELLKGVGGSIDQQKIIREGFSPEEIEAIRAEKTLQPKPTQVFELGGTQFTLENSLDLNNPSKVPTKANIQYHGPRLQPEMLDKFVNQINEVLTEAYKAIAGALGFSMEEKDGMMQFKDASGKEIGLEQRLQMEEQLQGKCNDLFASKGYNVRMIANGNVDVLQEKVAQQKAMQQPQEKSPQFATPFNTNPFRTRPQPK